MKVFEEKALKVESKETIISQGELRMEKICIVKRRIKVSAAANQEVFGDERQEPMVNEATGGQRSTSVENNKQHVLPDGIIVKDEDHVIRIQLTPQQCKVVRSNGCLSQLLGRILGNVDLDLEQYEDGQIVFNIHLKQVNGANMLSSKNVCQMLQISRSFLRKLVKNGIIKSYKIGKLRRFLLEDILDYLSQGEVLGELLGQKPDNWDSFATEQQTGSQLAS
ncbi:MAG: Helix-turn-helix domain protein [Syntrophorhabdus sp. PtaU1.Bin002]|nr:MAG: Helix-turn-helix domain protein [Syntrophorhabdus sp. PtaU1.Bin002]